MASVDTCVSLLGVDAAFAEFGRVQSQATAALAQLQNLPTADCAACKETLENTIQYYTYTLNDKISDAAALWDVVHGGRATRSCVSKLHRINQDLLKLTASMQAEEGEEC